MKSNQRTFESLVPFFVLWVFVLPAVSAAELTAAQTEAIDRARTAGLAAQKAAVIALKAAEDAIGASDTVVRQEAVQRALKAAAEANEAASTAQLAAASVQSSLAQTVSADTAPAALLGTAATATTKRAEPTAPSISIADADVSASIKAGEADNTASITMTWATQTVKKALYRNVTLSAPTSSNGNATRIGTLDGLVDAASIKLAQVVYFPMDPLHPDEQFWSIGLSGKVGEKGRFQIPSATLG